MTILKDIFDMVKDIKKDDALSDILSTYSKPTSMSKMAQDGILNFPTIVTKSIDIETSQMVSKALERQYASFAQVVFTMNPFLDPSKDANLKEYLKNFHQNMNSKLSSHDVASTLLTISESDMSQLYNVLESDNVVVMDYKVYEGSTGKIINENKKNLRDVFEGVNTSILNNMNASANNMSMIFEAKNKNKGKSILPSSSDELSSTGDDIEREKFEETKRMNNHIISRDIKKSELDNAIAQSNVMQKNVQIQYDYAQMDQQAKDNKANRKLKKQELDLKRTNIKDKDVTYVPQNILKDNDVKKANELVPTTMHIRVAVLAKDNTVSKFMDFIIGIKSTMHPVTSEEMIRNVVSAVRGNNKIFDFIRWTTGEIKFLKDFVFNVDEIKEDVINKFRGDSRWWTALKRRKGMAKIKNNLFMGKTIMPNASIVMSAQEVDFINSEYGINLEDNKLIDKIMREFFLLSFVIVDASSQTVKFLFDGESDFQTITYGSLERENSNSKNEFKEMLKMVNRL